MEGFTYFISDSAVSCSCGGCAYFNFRHICRNIKIEKPKYKNQSRFAIPYFRFLIFRFLFSPACAFSLIPPIFALFPRYQFSAASFLYALRKYAKNMFPPSLEKWEDVIEDDDACRAKKFNVSPQINFRLHTYGYFAPLCETSVSQYTSF